MPRGGVRPGAGRKPANRKPGAATTKTREIANRIAADGGKSMLEIMVANARYFDQQAADAEAALAFLRPENLAKLSAQDQFDFMMAEVKKAAGLRDRAQSCAEGAARFCHPILSPIDGKPRDAEFVPLADRLKAYSTRDAIEKSGGKVVELKRKGTKR
jgi:hypothetical protein